VTLESPAVAAAADAPHASWIYLGLATFVAVLWLAMLPARPLFNTDEGRYAEIPREMLHGGDWVIPHLNGLAYIEKPPLQYWATALSLWVFGEGEFAARLYTACCALGTLAVVWVLVARLWNAAAAWRAAAVLSSMLLFVVMGDLLTLDMSLTFYMTLALAAFLLAQRAGEPRPPRSGAPRLGALGAAAPRALWMLTAWAAVALGVMTKGLVAAAIPSAVLVCYSLFTRDFAPWRRLRVVWGLPLFLVMTVPWHWLAARRLPDFLEFFFVHEHLARYLTPSADREEVWWFFGAVFVLGSIPWTISALRVLCLTWRRRAPPGEFDAAIFLWIWVLFIGFFFSLSDSKLIPYLLPAMPAVAMLIGALPIDTLRRDALVTAAFTIAAGIALLAVSALGPRFLAPSERNQYFLQLAEPLLQIGVLLGVSGVFVLLRCRRDLTRAVVFLGVGWCMAGLLLTRAAAHVAPVYSGVVLARALDPTLAGVPLYSVATYDQTLPFYWRRTMRLVAYRGELDFGLRHDPGAEIPDVAAFVAQWQSLTDGYAVMERDMFDDLKGRGLPMRELARDLHRVLVARR
jgi:4-amino-4-deoxy-L-arabinose transferase-like glycosyltransferase